MRFSLTCITAVTALLSAISPAWAFDETDFSGISRNLAKGGNGKGKGQGGGNQPNPNRFIISGMTDELDEDATEADAMKNFGGKAKMRLQNKKQKKGKLVIEFSDATNANNFKKKYEGKLEVEQDLPRYTDAGLRHGNGGKNNAETVADTIRNLQSQQVPWGISNVFEDESRGVPGSEDGGPYLPSNVQHPICIIDSGYELDHPDLPKTATNADPGQTSGTALYFGEDGCGHGSHVAGTIAASDNGQGVIGVYPDADNIKVVKVFGTTGSTSCYWSYTSNLVDAYNDCVDSGAKIVTMSLGGGGFSSTEFNAYKEDTLNNDMLIIAAAGNGGDSSYSYPASYEYVMSVGAIDSNNNIASFSQHNDQVDISGPGVSVRSTVGTGYSYYSGTSMATPHVSGVALLLWNNFPTCTNVEIRTALEESAQDLGDSGRDDYYGYGAVKYWAAFDYLTNNPCDATSTPPPSTTSSTTAPTTIMTTTTSTTSSTTTTASTTPPPSDYSLVAPSYIPSDPFYGYLLEGYFYDLKAKSTAVAIKSVTFHTIYSGSFSFFTKSPDSYSDGSTFAFEDLTDWQPILSSVPVGSFTTYTITFGSPLIVPAGERRPFHFFSTGGLSGNLIPGDATYWQGPYSPYVQDDSLILSEGFAVPYLFGRSFYGGYNMNGLEIEYTHSDVGIYGTMSGDAKITEVGTSPSPNVASVSNPDATGVDLKPKNAKCRLSSECLSNNCHGNGKCK